MFSKKYYSLNLSQYSFSNTSKKNILNKYLHGTGRFEEDDDWIELYPEGEANNGYMNFQGQYLTIHQFVDAMSVSSGSFKGGQTVTIIGAGLGVNTRVTVYKNGQATRTVIYNSNTETVEFGMPSVSSVGSALVVISHSITDDKTSFVFGYNNAMYVFTVEWGNERTSS